MAVDQQGFAGIVQFVSENLRTNTGGEESRRQLAASELVAEVSAEVSAEVAAETASEVTAEMTAGAGRA